MDIGILVDDMAARADGNAASGRENWIAGASASRPLSLETHCGHRRAGRRAGVDERLRGELIAGVALCVDGGRGDEPVRIWCSSDRKNRAWRGGSLLTVSRKMRYYA